MRKPSSSSSAEVAAGGTPCCSKVGLKRGPWTAEEDEVLASYIQREGEGRWRMLPKRAGLLRCGKSCRLRWMNYLRPDVKRGRIAPDEEDLILRLHRLLGNRWSLIAGRIPGRTDNEIKNYWNTHLSKKLISQGIDPRTHKPLSTNNPTILSSPKLQEAPELPTPAAAPAPNPNFNLHGHHIYTAVGESEGFSGGFSLQQDHNNYFNEINLYSSERWKLTEGFAAVDYQRSNREISNEEGFTDCCGDEDVFSSFLNSLINEDAYLQQQQQCQLDYNNDNQNNNYSISTQVAKLDTPISSAANLGMGELWAGSLSSPASLDQDISGKFVDHVGKHF